MQMRRLRSRFSPKMENANLRSVPTSMVAFWESANVQGTRFDLLQEDGCVIRFFCSEGSHFFALGTLSFGETKILATSETQKMNVKDDPPPSFTDLNAWRKAIETGSFRRFKPEVLVCALQDIRDRFIREILASRLSDVMMALLRSRVGGNHPNEGWDIIERVHTELLTSLVDRSSADGKAMRSAFFMIVNYRIKTAIATELKHSRIPTAPPVSQSESESETDSLRPSESAAESGDQTSGEISEVNESGAATELERKCDREEAIELDDEAYHSGSLHDPSLLDGVRDVDEMIDVKRILATIPNEKKRLAFYLYMDHVPIHSTKGYSIAEALGVDRKTVKKWITEVRNQLSQLKEVKLLESASSGGRQ